MNYGEQVQNVSNCSCPCLPNALVFLTCIVVSGDILTGTKHGGPFVISVLDKQSLPPGHPCSVRQGNTVAPTLHPAHCQGNMRTRRQQPHAKAVSAGQGSGSKTMKTCKERETYTGNPPFAICLPTKGSWTCLLRPRGMALLITVLTGPHMWACEISSHT